jgi:hypothetical protein
MINSYTGLVKKQQKRGHSEELSTGGNNVKINLTKFDRLLRNMFIILRIPKKNLLYGVD